MAATAMHYSSDAYVCVCVICIYISIINVTWSFQSSSCLYISFIYVTWSFQSSSCWLTSWGQMWKDLCSSKNWSSLSWGKLFLVCCSTWGYKHVSPQLMQLFLPTNTCWIMLLLNSWSANTPRLGFKIFFSSGTAEESVMGTRRRSMCSHWMSSILNFSFSCSLCQPFLTHNSDMASRKLMPCVRGGAIAVMPGEHPGEVLRFMVTSHVLAQYYTITSSMYGLLMNCSSINNVIVYAYCINYYHLANVLIYKQINYYYPSWQN